MENDLSWLRTNWFHYIDTSTMTENGVFPHIFGYEKCSSNKGKIVYTKNIHTLHFVISGKGMVNGQEVSAGQVFVLKSDCKIEYVPNNTTPWEYVWVEFSGFLSDRYIKYAGFDENHIINNIKDFYKIINIFKHVFLDVRKNNNHHARSMEYTASLLMMFSVLTEENGYLLQNEAKSSQQVKMEEMFRYIGSNYANPNLNVTLLAKQFSYVPSYLTRLFVKYIGMGPNKFISKTRMDKAVDFLKQHKLSIEQISIATGFKNQFYFSKEFKKCYGVSPKQFRNENIKK